MASWWSDLDDLDLWFCFSAWPSLRLLSPNLWKLCWSILHAQRWLPLSFVPSKERPSLWHPLNPLENSRVPALVSSCRIRWAKGWWEQIQPGKVGVVQSHVKWTWKNLMTLPGSLGPYMIQLWDRYRPFCTSQGWLQNGKSKSLPRGHCQLAVEQSVLSPLIILDPFKSV